MLDKDPSSYSLLTYLWVIALGMWGGLVSFYGKLRKGEVRIFNITELIGEIVTAGFVGVLTFWLCESSELNPLLSAALIGISGHMGSRGIYAMELLMSNKLGIDVKDKSK